MEEIISKKITLLGLKTFWVGQFFWAKILIVKCQSLARQGKAEWKSESLSEWLTDQILGVSARVVFFCILEFFSKNVLQMYLLINTVTFLEPHRGSSVCLLMLKHLNFYYGKQVCSLLRALGRKRKRRKIQFWLLQLYK